MTDPSSTSPEFPANSWRVILLLAAAASAGYICRVAITVVAPGIMHDFHLTQAEMGTVFSAFLLGYTAFQVPSGRLADRVSAHRIFLVLCFGFSALTVLTALVGWRGFALGSVILQLCLIRAVFGAIAAPTYPTSARTIAVIVPARLQARANSVVLASVGVGSALTPLMLSPISISHRWRLPLLIPAALSAIVGLLWWRFGARDHHQHGVAAENPIDGGDRNAPPSRPLRMPSFWFLFSSYLLQSYLGYIFIFWLYLYLVQVRHFEVLKAASFTALPWLATIFAIPLGGVFSDWAVRQWGAAWGRRSLPLVSLCGSAIFLVIGARTATPAIAVGALTACTVLVICTEGPFWASMNQLAREHSGIAGGTMNFGGNLGGLISPALTPWLAERIGWQSALSFSAALAVLAGLLWLGVRIDDQK